MRRARRALPALRPPASCRSTIAPGLAPEPQFIYISSHEAPRRTRRPLGSAATEGAQAIDQTTREASEERRELVSHHTRVENILTLLNAKYVGTPHLRFSLSPSPMTLLSVDPSDPNLWFAQLLARRSSGLEGIQEFTTVVIVPRGEDFCVNARLRRVCVLDVPPGPLEFTEPFNLQLHIGRVLNYLDRVYPPGTPLEEFDVDLVGALPTPDDFTRPVLRIFSVAGFVMIAEVTSPTPLPFPGSVKNASVNYKMHLELWLETLYRTSSTSTSRRSRPRGALRSPKNTS